MGGNLFSLGRLAKDDYLKIEAELCTRLDERWAGLYRIPRFIGDKPDFGDVDILLSNAAKPADWPELQQALLAHLGITKHQVMPKLLSTVYRNFQVDFFRVSAEGLDGVWRFLCYNDLGNILGKLFRRFGLKYGMDGLSYVFRRTEGSYRRDIHLSSDWPRILAFLELDDQVWDAGFATYRDLFDWVIAGPYFTVAPFLDRSRRTRAREKRRSTMSRFIDHLESEAIASRYPFDNDREAYIPKIVAAFPEVDLEAEIGREKEHERVAVAVKERFNGRLVMKLFPELEGKELGIFIKRFKDRYSDFQKSILAMSPEAIKAALIEHHRADKQAQRDEI